MIQYALAASDTELEQILELQRHNLPQSISEEEKINEGFVTVHHNLQLLKEMNDACAHTIAKSEDKVVGYALSMHPKFGNSIEVLKPMFDQLKKYTSSIGNFLVMGQVCIDKNFRKQGIFRNLYLAMKDNHIPPFDTIVTEVDAANQRSLQAHYAIGFEQLGTYSSGGQDWELIVLR